MACLQSQLLKRKSQLKHAQAFYNLKAYVEVLQQDLTIILDQCEYLSEDDWMDLYDLSQLEGKGGCKIRFVTLTFKAMPSGAYAEICVPLSIRKLSGCDLFRYVDFYSENSRLGRKVELSWAALGSLSFLSRGLPARINQLLDTMTYQSQRTSVHFGVFAVLMAFVKSKSKFRSFARFGVTLGDGVLKYACVSALLILMLSQIVMAYVWVSERQVVYQDVSMPKQTDVQADSSFEVSSIQLAQKSIEDVEVHRPPFQIEMVKSTLADGFKQAIMSQDSQKIEALMSLSSESEFVEHFDLIKPLLKQKVTWLDVDKICENGVDATQSPKVVLTCGDWWAQQKQYQKALDWFKLPLTYSHDTSEYFEKKAYYLLKSGYSAQAIEQYQSLIDKNPGQARLWLGLGSALKLQGNTIEAKQAFDKALSRAPQHASYRSFLMREIHG